jgi:hypothetical protein
MSLNTSDIGLSAAVTTSYTSLSGNPSVFVEDTETRTIPSFKPLLLASSWTVFVTTIGIGVKCINKLLLYN